MKHGVMVVIKIPQAWMHLLSKQKRWNKKQEGKHPDGLHNLPLNYVSQG